MRVIACLLLIYSLASCSTQNEPVKFADNVVVAHRGAWKAEGFPENSIAALKHAIKLKCTGSEFDVRMTADDSLIVTHDPHYNDLLIEETNYSELAKLKLTNGETLPTLRNYILAGLENNTSTRLVCEIKPSKSKERGALIAEKALALVDELNAKEMTIYISFGYTILEQIKQLNPQAHAQYLDGSKTPEQLSIDGIDGADYHFSVYKKNNGWIKSAKAKNIVLNAWTVDKSEDMDWLISEEFDFITTNEPELLLQKQ